MSKTRGVRGAAGWCAIAAILYLLARSLLYAGISALVGVVHPGASLAKPIGVSEVGLGLLQIVIAVGAALVPLLWRHPPANRRPAHHRARAMEPGILPAGVFGRGQHG